MPTTSVQPVRTVGNHCIRQMTAARHERWHEIWWAWLSIELQQSHVHFLQPYTMPNYFLLTDWLAESYKVWRSTQQNSHVGDDLPGSLLANTKATKFNTKNQDIQKWPTSQCSMTVHTLLLEWQANPMETWRFQQVRTPNPMNRLTKNLVWVIMSAITPDMPKFKTIVPLGALQCMCKIWLSRGFWFAFPFLVLWPRD